MRAPFTPRFRLLAAGLLLALTNMALAATAEIPDMDPNLSAKVARERAKQTMRSGGQSGSDSSKCGEMNIANDDAPKTASQRMANRDKTVIITGPVISAARCR